MFDASAYGEAVSSILALDGNGERLMPLAMLPAGAGRSSAEQARALIRTNTARGLFPNARAPEAAMAGLYLYFSCIEEAHQIAQGVGSAEGSFWHAILHRQEPDADNAGYWFRRVGAHPIFPALRERAAALGVDFGGRWDPLAFIDLCEKARTKPGSAAEMRAMEVQRAEWQLLFAYCAASGQAAG
ncbi:MAG TPA: hypothetical protein VNY05_19260 [Candidatus Acidoferrales bacterium]|jgi:hypothetical protein|nr:hypothetical protein [Candidatus Acidoferrales bacterium]